MPYSFTPPANGIGRPAVDTDPVGRDRNPMGNRLARHMPRVPVGINIWIREDGSLTEEQLYRDEARASKGQYFGGHVYTVTTEERDVLVAAGYTVTGSP